MNDLKNKAFLALIKNDNDWNIDNHYAYHIPSKIKYWIANGLFFFRSEGKNNVNIGLINKIKLYFWIKNVERKRVINSVNKSKL